MPTELAALQQARAALGAGDPARALSMLDAYVARFPHGAMAQEAAVLRIEALVRAGDRPAAQRAADAYLTAHPQSPYMDRIRSLLGTNP
jgi:outer membrane protein assembly factor BamD (BamD/ComL family)